MQVKVKRWKAYESGNMLGFVDISFDDFVIVKAKLMQGKNGSFLAMPSYKNTKTDKYENLVVFYSKEIAEDVTRQIVAGTIGSAQKSTNPEDIAWDE